MRNLLALLALAVSGPTFAADAVTIIFVPGDCIGCSTENSELTVQRTSVPGSIATRLDELFDGLGRSLVPVKPSAGCELVPAIHSDSIRIEVMLGKAKYVLTAPYEEGAVPKATRETAQEATCRQAIVAVLRETLRFSAKRFPVAGAQ
jgi:hypothetical protein